jgi:hypothetical protein
MSWRSLVQQITVRRKNRSEVRVDRGDPVGDVASAGPKLAWITVEEAPDGRGARDGIRACVDLGTRRVGALGCPAGVGDDRRESAGDGLGDSKAVGLARATVDEEIRRGERASQARAVLVEAREDHTRGRAAFELRSLRAVAEEDEDGAPVSADALERVDHDVPALLDGESPHADEQESVLRSVTEELATARLVSRLRAEDVPVDAERHVDHLPNACSPEAAGLHLAADERRIEGQEERAKALPQRRAELPGRRGRHDRLQCRLDVRADVV